MNTIHRVFEYILIKTKNIEKVCYYSKKTYYYYLEYMEQIYSSNLHQNLNQMDAMLFVYKKTIFDLYDGENEDTFGTMTNIIASNGEIMNIDDDNIQNMLKKISKIMNTLFYWENTEFTFYERKELCNYLDFFMKKCFSVPQIVQFLEILQKKITMKYPEYLLLVCAGGSQNNIIGDDVGLGKCYYVNGKTACRANVCSLVSKTQEYNIKYINYYLNINRIETNKKAHFTTNLGTISLDDIKSIKIPIPSLDKQQEIVGLENRSEEKKRSQPH